MNWKEYPDELIKGRESAEATFIFCLWKQPDLYDDFPRETPQMMKRLKQKMEYFIFLWVDKCSIKVLGLSIM